MTRLSVPSSACIVLSGPSDRAFVSCYSTVTALKTEQLDIDALVQCHHIHIGGYYGIRGLHTKEFLDVLKKCREKGATISVGTNSDPEEKYTGENKHFCDVLPLADLLILNESELEGLTSALGPVFSLAPNIVVIETIGKQGAKVHLGANNAVVIPTYLVPDPVDLTGAGDSFAAGFLSRWLQDDHDAVAAAAWGNAVACCNVKRRGACQEPVPKEDVAEMHKLVMGASTSS